MARILVVGGSLGGLMAANLLLRAGHDVTVLERSPRSLQGRGAGIVTHEGLRQALRAAGVVVDHTLGIPVALRVVLGADGSTLCEWGYPQILTSWGRLYSLLSDALPAAHHRLGAAVVAVTAFDDHVSVQAGRRRKLARRSADRRRRHTQHRAQRLVARGEARSTRATWPGAVSATKPCCRAHTRETLFPHFGFGLPAGEQMIGYPVAGDNGGNSNRTAVGQRRWNFVWYRPAAAGASAGRAC